MPKSKSDPFGGSGSAVELQFDVLHAYWKHGNVRLKPADAGDVEYYGGWCVDTDKFEAYLSSTGQEAPIGWKRRTMTAESGKTYDVYTCRSVTFAPITKRKAWFKRRDQSGKETDKSNSAVNILGYMATPNTQTKTFEAYGFVVLSAKSLTGKNLEDLLAKWAAEMRPTLRANGNMPQDPRQYYLTIGTFGDKIITTSYKGAAGAESTVTPPQLKADQITAEYLGKRWVGEEIAAVCENAGEEAQEWADDWNNRDTRKPGPEEEQQGGNGNGNWPPPEIDPDAEIPF